jgi:DNA-binding GntR family transcriptional regulator
LIKHDVQSGKLVDGQALIVSAFTKATGIPSKHVRNALLALCQTGEMTHFFRVGFYVGDHVMLPRTPSVRSLAQPKDPIVTEATQRLVDAIKDGRLEQGAQLQYQTVSEMLGVKLTIARRAVLEAVHMGYALRPRHRGSAIVHYAAAHDAN